jgi:hypothetical protein
MKIHTLLITTIAIAFANAQENVVDPFAAEKKILEVEEQASDIKVAPNISICYEDFSLPLAQAAALQRNGLTDAEFYMALIGGPGNNSVRQETFTVLRGKSGMKSTNENISELIYPTEYLPAQLSNAVTTGVPGTDKDGKATAAGPLPVAGPVAIARTPATPAAFETRNLGFTLEIDPSLDEEKGLLELRLIPEHTTLAGRSSWGQEFSTVETPIIDAQKLSTAVTIKINEPFLLGTISRPPVSKADPDSANRVWFAFVTAKLTR